MVTGCKFLNDLIHFSFDVDTSIFFVHFNSYILNNLPACIQLQTYYDPMLFIGTAKQAENEKLYEKLQIGSCINLSQNKRINYPAGLNRLDIDIPDETNSNLFEHFTKTTEFLQKAIQSGTGNCFVFCQMGISRSSSVVLAYLIADKKLTLKSAFDLLKSCRPIIRPNFGFLKQLKQWEAQHIGSSSDLDEIYDLY